LKNSSFSFLDIDSTILNSLTVPFDPQQSKLREIRYKNEKKDDDDNDDDGEDHNKLNSAIEKDKISKKSLPESSDFVSNLEDESLSDFDENELQNCLFICYFYILFFYLSFKS
jgi:hypothetical protein